VDSHPTYPVSELQPQLVECPSWPVIKPVQYTPAKGGEWLHTNPAGWKTKEWSRIHTSSIYANRTV